MFLSTNLCWPVYVLAHACAWEYKPQCHIKKPDLLTYIQYTLSDENLCVSKYKGVLFLSTNLCWPVYVLAHVCAWEYEFQCHIRKLD